MSMYDILSLFLIKRRVLVSFSATVFFSPTPYITLHNFTAYTLPIFKLTHHYEYFNVIL